MAKIKVMSIFGTRPEAIKMAPLVHELNKYPDQIETEVAVTAQHREMLDQVLQLFKIVPDYDLNVMQERQTLTDVTIRALAGLEDVIKKSRPDMILVHGDTTTTFVASLAAFYHQVVIGHVEAGLRTYRKDSPFPEEMNRQLTGVLADLHFAPTRRAALNLIQEHKPEEAIFITGNTAIDALQTTVRKDYSHPILERLGDSRLVLMTAHRRENWGEPMERIFKAVRRLVDDVTDIQVVYPVHLNPRVQETARSILGGHERIHLIDPLDVLDFHNFAARAYLILTDSGGIQEEAPSLGVPVLVLRDTTERPEGVEAGTLKLAGTEEETVYRLSHQLLTDKGMHQAMAQASNPYGDGQASRRIVQAILHYFGRSPERPAPFGSHTSVS
jgi:UDP-N-acetylglucosamine 2-epimerase (non-hydrolysing)